MHELLREDIKCVWHTHHQAISSIMTLKTGILPMCLEAVQIWPKISPTIHQFEGVSTDEAEKPRLCSSLGDKTILQMANHGVCVGSETIQGAFWDMYLIQMACIMQVKDTHSFTASLTPHSLTPSLPYSQLESMKAVGGRIELLQEVNPKVVAGGYAKAVVTNAHNGNIWGVKEFEAARRVACAGDVYAQ
jgi:hypothetical protein